MKTIIKSCIEKQQGTKKNKENLKLRLRGKGSGIINNFIRFN